MCNIYCNPFLLHQVLLKSMEKNRRLIPSAEQYPILWQASYCAKESSGFGLFTRPFSPNSNKAFLTQELFEGFFPTYWICEPFTIQVWVQANVAKMPKEKSLLMEHIISQPRSKSTLKQPTWHVFCVISHSQAPHFPSSTSPKGSFCSASPLVHFHKRLWYRFEGKYLSNDALHAALWLPQHFHTWGLISLCYPCKTSVRKILLVISRMKKLSLKEL